MSRFHNLAARLSVDPEDPEDPENPETETPTDRKDPARDDQKKEQQMADDTPIEKTEAYQAGHAAGLKAANERMNAVFASEHFAGREASAVKMLGKEMKADDIIDVLADMPKAEPKAANQDEANKAAEDAARKEMREEMDKAGNKDLGNPSDDDTNKGRNAADSVWDRAAKANGREEN